MKHTALSISCFFLLSFLFACSPKTAPVVEAPPQSEPEPEIVITGNDRDAHGCIGTAGYTWSILKQECIRIFEQGTSLKNAQDPNASTVCYILPSKDETQVEVFLPGKSESMMLKGSQGAWADDKNEYALTQQTNGSYQLYFSKGVLIYHTKK